MQLLISIFFGMVCAWALKRHADSSPLGHWRLVAGAVAGAFPHIDWFFQILGPSFYLAYKDSVTWSLLLMPIYAGLLLLRYLGLHLIKPLWITSWGNAH